MTKDLVKTSDLENIVTGIVKKLFSKFVSSLEKKMNEKIIKIQNEMEEKVEALSIENEDLKKRLEVSTAQITSIKKEFSETEAYFYVCEYYLL
jgi:regulator of replication initiation timing